MKKIGKISLTLTFLLSVIIPQSKSNANGLQSLITGQDVPLSIPLQKIDNSWRKISISGQYEINDIIKTWSDLFGISSYNNVYYTQGKTVTVGNKTYIVAYRVANQKEPVDWQTLFASWDNKSCDDQFFPTVLTETTPVSLALLNLDSIGSLNDIQTVNIQQEINLSQQRYQKAKQACEKLRSDSLNQEAKQYISTMNVGQQSYFVEREQLTDSLESLYLGINPETENYSYSIKVNGNSAAFNYAIAKDSSLISYVGGVFVVDEGETKNTVTIICAANQPGTTSPPNPILQDNIPVCASGTKQVF